MLFLLLVCLFACICDDIFKASVRYTVFRILEYLTLSAVLHHSLTHALMQAWNWNWVKDADYFVSDACTSGYSVKVMEQAGIPVIVGEWSLATGTLYYWCRS